MKAIIAKKSFFFISQNKLFIDCFFISQNFGNALLKSNARAHLKQRKWLKYANESEGAN